MIFKILKDDAQNIVCLSNVLKCDDQLEINLRADHSTMPTIIKSRHETCAHDDTFYTANSTIPDYSSYQATSSMPITKTSDLVRRSLIINTPEDNQRLGLKIVKTLDSHQCDLNDDPSLKELIVTSKDDSVEDIMSYNTILDHIQSQCYQGQIERRSKRFTYHECLLPHSNPNYNGSLYNLMIA